MELLAGPLVNLQALGGIATTVTTFESENLWDAWSGLAVNHELNEYPHDFDLASLARAIDRTFIIEMFQCS